jgi:SAM-dependent methyltransferase
VGTEGQSVLDLGAGTGLLGEALAQRGARVILADAGAGLLAHAGGGRRIVAQAERLPFAPGTFDVVTAAQAWHWFDRYVAPFEVLRVLRPGGRVAIVYQFYLPLPGNVAEASERLILRHRPAWKHANSAGISGPPLRDVTVAGFQDIESFSFDRRLEFTRQQWRGFIRTTSAVGPSMPPAVLERFDADHAALLETWPEPIVVPHRFFCVVAAKAGAG